MRVALAAAQGHAELRGIRVSSSTPGTRPGVAPPIGRVEQELGRVGAPRETARIGWAVAAEHQFGAAVPAVRPTLGVRGEVAAQEGRAGGAARSASSVPAALVWDVRELSLRPFTAILFVCSGSDCSALPRRFVPRFVFSPRILSRTGGSFSHCTKACFSRGLLDKAPSLSCARRGEQLPFSAR